LPGCSLVLCFRTAYRTGYRQAYGLGYRTASRCCPGWSQRGGDAGCLHRECRAARVRFCARCPHDWFFWLRVLFSSPVPAVNATKMSLKRTGVLCCCLLLGFLYLFVLTVCQKDFSLAPQAALCVAFRFWRMSSPQHERVFRVASVYPVAKCY